MPLGCANTVAEALTLLVGKPTDPMTRFCTCELMMTCMQLYGVVWQCGVSAYGGTTRVTALFHPELEPHATPAVSYQVVLKRVRVPTVVVRSHATFRVVMHPSAPAKSCAASAASEIASAIRDRCVAPARRLPAASAAASTAFCAVC